MKIAIIQTFPQRGEAGRNLARLDGVLAALPDAVELVVLPEMFSTGQYIDPAPVAETADGLTHSWMCAKSRQLDAAVVGSVPIIEDGKFYNRQYFVKPDGTEAFYNKKHLFSYSGEGKYFTPGRDRCVVEFRGIRFFLQVCYDMRFPVFSRNMNDYDVVIYSAFWPDRRILAWDTLLRARAIENQVYAIGANCVGEDQFGHYSGHSALINPYGETLVQSPDGVEGFSIGLIDMEMLERYREKFPVLNDSDCACRI